MENLSLAQKQIARVKRQKNKNPRELRAAAINVLVAELALSNPEWTEDDLHKASLVISNRVDKAKSDAIRHHANTLHVL